MNPIESPIAENYHDIVFSQQRHQPAQDRVGIPHSWDRRRSKATYRAITFLERDVYHLPIYSIVDEPLAGTCRGRLVSWFGTVLNHKGGSDKDRKMTRTHPAYTTSPSNQTPQPTFSRLVPSFPMIKILQRQPSRPLLGAAELELVR
jgi:hypothetical protein